MLIVCAQAMLKRRALQRRALLAQLRMGKHARAYPARARMQCACSLTQCAHARYLRSWTRCRRSDRAPPLTGLHYLSLLSISLTTTGGHGASTATVYFLFAKQLRDSGLPADVLLGKLKKDISFALRRGTIAQVTTALDAAQRAVEYEESLALNRRAGGLGSLDSPLLPLP